MNRNMLKNSLIGAGIGIGAALILLLVFCAVLTKCGDPARLVPVAAAVARFIGAAAAGFSAARFNRENGLVTGALSGGFYALLIPLAAAFSDGEFRILPLLLVCLICTAISAVCGIIGVPGEKSGRAKRRAMMKRLSAGR